MIPKGWKKKTIDDLCDLLNGNGFKSSEWDTTGLPIIRIQNLNGSRDFNYFSGEPKERWIVQPGDLLFAWAGVKGVSFGPCLWSGPTGVLNQHIYKVIPKNGVSCEFLHALLDVTTQRIEANSHGFKANFVHVQKGDIVDQTVHVPPLPEQQKIAAILSTWDRAIELTEKLIAAKQKRKQALVQQLLTGKVRFREFEGKPWTWVELGRLTKQVKRPIVWNEDQLYKLASIRRHSKGMFFREPAYGHQIKVKKLFTVEKNDFLISNIQAAYGAMGLVPKKFDNTYISDQYTVLAAIDEKKFDIHFLGFVSETAWFRQQILLACNGFFAERLRLLFSADELLKRKLFVPPSIKEQRRIVEVLHTAVRELRSAEKRLKNLKEQKKGLMQQLLTGRVRVNVDAETVKG